MTRLADAIDRVNRGLGIVVAWFVLAMVLLQFAIVLARYVFGTGSLIAGESVAYMHAFVFLLAAPYTLAVDGHVRVDILYRSAGPRRRAAVDLFGALFLLIPVALFITASSWSYVAASWRILERSREASGIPGVFLLKTAIPVFGILMAAQGLVMILRALSVLSGRAEVRDRPIAPPAPLP